MKLSVLKGIFHTIDPQKYPLPDQVNSLETATVAYLHKKTQEQQEFAKNNVRQLMTEPTSNIIRNLYGPLEKVDLHSAISVRDQVEKLNLSSQVMLTPGHLNRLEFSGDTIRMRERLPEKEIVPDIGHRPFLKMRRELIDSSSLANAQIVELGHRSLPISSSTAVTISPSDPIVSKYVELGGDAGFLGKATGGQGTCPDGRGKYQHYEHGSIYWSPETGAHEIHGLIREKWKNMGWETCFLGYPVTDELTTPDTIGRFTHFQGGSIYWTPELGAHEIHGAIRDKWANVQWERGYLGYPITDELTTPDTIGRYTHFQGGSIYWTPETGAYAIHKKIFEPWEKQSWEQGFLGYPISDTSISSNSMSCTFQGGQIFWDEVKGVRIDKPKTKLQLRIHKVECLDETDPDWWGSDAIDMGGVATSLNNQVSTLINQFPVSHQFEAGVKVVYNPPKPFFTFDLQKMPGWPKHCLVTMALAEIDCGGFADLLQTAVKMIGDHVIYVVSEYVKKMTSAALSSVVGALAGPIGAGIAAIVSWIAGEFFDWLGSLFKDDLFPVWTAVFSLPSVWHRWSGYADSPEYGFWTQDHGGKYQVWFDWALLA
jgi:hypothetical protein